MSDKDAEIRPRWEDHPVDNPDDHYRLFTASMLFDAAQFVISELSHHDNPTIKSAIDYLAKAIDRTTTPAKGERK